MKMPKEIAAYCSRCRNHQLHAISVYKAGKRRALAEGERRHEREKKGYGGQKYSLQRKFSKTTKKQTLKLVCKACGHAQHRDGMRLKKLDFS
ncbi:MAG: 50S ribosomal protein L44e [Candidatus Bathyarchaeota archaeon]|nr:MAG: 50S ribosomal protein L44e [Candidatus Bathyarchaeota archaeon]